MKKVILGIILLSLLVGCGEKKYSTSDKKTLIKEAYGWTFESKEKEETSKAKLDKIMGDLEEKATKGDKKAAAELQEWKDLLPIQAHQANKTIGREIGTWD